MKTKISALIHPSSEHLFLFLFHFVLCHNVPLPLGPRVLLGCTKSLSIEAVSTNAFTFFTKMYLRHFYRRDVFGLTTLTFLSRSSSLRHHLHQEFLGLGHHKYKKI